MAGAEVLASDLCDYLRFDADCVLGAAGEEMAGDEVVHAPLVGLHAAAVCRLDWVDGRVGLIVLVSHLRLHELALLHQLSHVVRVFCAVLEPLDQLRHVHCGWEGICLGPRVADEPVHV